jgi:hypothetical protein
MIGTNGRTQFLLPLCIIWNNVIMINDDLNFNDASPSGIIAERTYYHEFGHGHLLFCNHCYWIQLRLQTVNQINKYLWI